MPQFPAQGGDGLVIRLGKQPQSPGQLGVVAPHRGRVLGAYPPHQVVGAGVPPGVLDRQPGFAQPAQPGDDLDGSGGAVGAERLVQRRQLVVPAGEIGIRPVPTQFPRLRHGAVGLRRRSRILSPRFLQCVQQFGLELLRAGQRADGDARVAKSLPEGLLPGPQIRVAVVQPGRRDRQHRVLVKHEYQPRYPGFGRGVELELGVRNIRTIPYRRPVAQADQADVNVAALPHHVTAVFRWLFVSCREVGHVRRRVARARHGGFRRGHERPVSRKLPEFRCVAEKYPPW